MKNSIEKLVEHILLEALEPPINVYFDMDGVLANFEGAIEKNEAFQEAKDKFEELLELKPEIRQSADDDYKEVFRGRQENPLMARLKKAWNKQRNLSYAIAAEPGHFIKLDVLPGAHEMVKMATRLTGRRPHILTAPMTSSPNCEEEKKEWIKTHFRGLYDRFHCTQNKGGFANSEYDILIDDRPKFINQFRAGGGIAIAHTDPAKTMVELEQVIKRLKAEQ
jgi:5'(3')-deoxyribonucleotidase